MLSGGILKEEKGSNQVLDRERLLVASMREGVFFNVCKLLIQVKLRHVLPGHPARLEESPLVSLAPSGPSPGFRELRKSPLHHKSSLRFFSYG